MMMMLLSMTTTMLVMMMLIYNDDDVIGRLIFRHIPDRQHMLMKTIILINVTVTYCFVVTSIDRSIGKHC
jgi:hypothetical protein